MKRSMLRLFALMTGIFLTVNTLYAQEKSVRRLVDQQNLIAWCIVPFDSKNRTPVERVEMLKRLGFSQYAYDWRSKHLDSFASEIEIARKNQVAISAVWLWIDKQTDKPGQLSEDNEKLLGILKASGLKTQLWVGFNDNYFADLDDAEKVAAGKEIVEYLSERTKGLVTKIGLYNHGDWFGNPLNQVKIIELLRDSNIGIVYNFHHAHEQIDEFASIATAMKPYLIAVNIDGIKRSGPQILPVGSGDEERGMLQTLIKNGYNGPIGILGHIETEDAEIVLKRNLDGLKKLSKTL